MEEKERLEQLEKFMEEMKKLVRNLGRTNFVSRSEVEELITKYDVK